MMASSLLRTNNTPRHSRPNPSPFRRSPALLLPFRFNGNASLLPSHSRLSPRSAAPSYGDSSLRKPLLSQRKRFLKEQGHVLYEVEEDEEEEEEEQEPEEDKWIDWEDQILADTVPLVGLVRMILHSGQYQAGDRLRPEHEKIVVEKLLPFHPEFKKKIGSGIDYIMIGYHPDFDSSKCLFIVRQDGDLVDFSYWKCIKGLIRKNYPLYADSFILRHFRKRSRDL